MPIMICFRCLLCKIHLGTFVVGKLVIRATNNELKQIRFVLSFIPSCISLYHLPEIRKRNHRSCNQTKDRNTLQQVHIHMTRSHSFKKVFHTYKNTQFTNAQLSFNSCWYISIPGFKNTHNLKQIPREQYIALSEALYIIKRSSKTGVLVQCSIARFTQQ